jgi:hypothetical protein
MAGIVDLAGKAPTDVVERRLEIVMMGPAPAFSGAGPRQVVLRRLDIEVSKAETGEVEFLHDRRGAKGEVIAVANVDRGACELLARRRTADLGAGFDQQRSHPRPSEICRRDQPVVSGADDDGIEVGGRGGTGSAHGGESLVVRCRRRNVAVCLSFRVNWPTCERPRSSS